MRAALYYAPQTDDPLWHAGCSWLGRDPLTNATLPQPAIHELPQLTADPRRYGLHATLKPPMRFTGTLAALREAARALAGRTASFPLPRLAVANIGGFLALTPIEPSPQLQSFADACVTEIDQLRVPPDEAELVRRRHARLSARENALLERWGYPYVLDCWQFHMTLTRRLTDIEAASLHPPATSHFAAACAQPRDVTDIALFTEAAPGEPFILVARLKLRA